MKSNLRLPFLLLAIWMIAFGSRSCKPEPEAVNFLMNEQDRPIIDELPLPEDTARLMEILVNDKIYFKDVSAPEERVNARLWDIDGNPGWEPETGKLAEWVFTQPGLFKVTLCVNGEVLCVSKCIKVTEPFIPIEEPVVKGPKSIITPPPPPKPLLKFTSPSSATVKSQKKEVDIEVETTNIQNKESLSLSMNGQPVAFEFAPVGKKGKLSAKLTLDKGINKVVAVATTNSGEFVEKSINISYNEPPAPLPGAPVIIGVASGTRPGGTACVTASRSDFSVQLKPTKEVELLSFKTYTNECGGMKILLKGPDLDETFTVALNAGQTQVSFGAIEARLKPGSTYTLTCNAFANYGGCPSKVVPKFENVNDCPGVKEATNPYLGLDQRGNLIVNDLKFSVL